ncbi:MAG: hypothetical protein WA971_11045 [Microbacterium sp.]
MPQITGGREMVTSSLALVRTLSSVFVPIGVVGVAIAVLCAVVAGVALARGAAGLTGGATGLWVVGVLLSFAGSFAGAWWLLFVALAALPVALVLGGLLRGVIVFARRAAPDAASEPVSAVVAVPSAPPAVNAPVAVPSAAVVPSTTASVATA